MNQRGVWDATTLRPMPAWWESYDAAAGKALLWVKVPGLGPQASQSLLLTAGHATGCAASLFDGYSVFPFFSDVHDVSAWHATNQLKITDTVTVGPLTIGGRSVIQSDNYYNGFPGVAQAANGDFVLAYKKGTTHVDSPLVVLRRSSDAGTTWSPEVVYFDSSVPDPALLRTPLGALVMALGKADQSGRELAAYSRSTDNGLTWTPFTFFNDPATDTFSVAPSLVGWTDDVWRGLRELHAGSRQRSRPVVVVGRRSQLDETLGASSGRAIPRSVKPRLPIPRRTHCSR